MKNIDSLVELFNLDIERNIPTFYSTLLLLISASLLMVITKHVKANSRDHVLQWTALTIGFLFMSYDKAFSLHERLVAPMREIIGMKSLGVFHFAWVVVALISRPCKTPHNHTESEIALHFAALNPSGIATIRL